MTMGAGTVPDITILVPPETLVTAPIDAVLITPQARPVADVASAMRHISSSITIDPVE